MLRALRTENIRIDLPSPQQPAWIHATLQRVEFDDRGRVMSISARQEEIFRKANEVASEVVDVYDPVTGATNSVSVAGVSEALRVLMLKWIKEDFPSTTYNEQLRRMVLP